jgi:uncharacterized protein (PEP-CTERM system associated)
VADRAAPRGPRRGRAGVIGCALLTAGAALPAGAQSPFLGDAPALGSGRPSSPFQAPLLPGQAEPPSFWQPDFLPDFGPGRPPPGAPPQPFSLRPSLEVQGAYTDNVRNTPNNKQSDFYGTIVPTITGAVDTVNLVGAITYAPRARFYAETSSQNRVDHFLRGQGTATLVQDRLFVDFSAVADARSVFGDFAGFDDSLDNDDNRVQSTSYRIGPYFLHRFGDIAVARIGYTFRQTIQSGNDAFADGDTRPFFTSTDFVSHQAYASLNSGDAWGRLGWSANVSTTEFDGDGIYDGAYNRVYAAQLRYALTRELAVLVDGGWQEAFYNGTVPFRVEDPIWAVGLRYSPDETSFLSVRFGQYDGDTAWFARGAIDIGVRTRLFVDVSQRLSNSALQASDSLSSLRVDALGNLVDTGTGVPAAIAFGSPLQSQQSGLFRVQRASVAISQSYTRDTLSLGLTREERDPVAVAPGTTAFSQDTTSVSVGWTRSLDPATTFSAAGRYGVSETDSGSQRNNYSFNARLARALSPTLFATLRYEFTSRETNQFGGRADRNTVTIALRQSF